MAVQTNNILLVEKDVSTGRAGLPRTLATTDEIEFDVASVSWAVTGELALATGGTTLDLQGPDVRIGTEDTGPSANVTIEIGHSASEITVSAAAAYIDAPLYLNSADVGIKVEAGEALAVGDVVVIDRTTNPTSVYVPRVVKAEADALLSGTHLFTGVITTSSISSGLTGYMTAMDGTVAGLNFKADDLPAIGSMGLPVYLSTEAGKAQMTAPTASGVTVYQIGLLTSSTAISGTRYAVLLKPQLISRIP